MANRFDSDPWLDNTDPFAHVDLTPEKPLLDSLADIVKANPHAAPDLVDTPEPPAATPVVQPEDNPLEPQVVEFQDGSSLIMEKTPRGWKATLDTGVQGVNPEIFYGKTKDELMENMAFGKVNATRQIRELNRKVKLGDMNRPVPKPPAQFTPQQPQAPVQPQARELTLDQKNELKVLYATDPVAAQEKWFLYTFGMPPMQAAAKIQNAEDGANEGRRARKELDMESVSRMFVQNTPEYYAINSNFISMVAWLAKYKLGLPLAGTNPNQMIEHLYDNGFWTPETLNEAYEELKEGGLLEFAPVEEEPEPVVTRQPEPPKVNQPPQDERIVRAVRRPRAGLGIRSGEASTARIPDTKPPTVEELDDLSDEEINQLFAGVRRQRLQSARRS